VKPEQHYGILCIANRALQGSLNVSTKETDNAMHEYLYIQTSFKLSSTSSSSASCKQIPTSDINAQIFSKQTNDFDEE
jgi:hypothetical protein